MLAWTELGFKTKYHTNKQTYRLVNNFYNLLYYKNVEVSYSWNYHKPLVKCTLSNLHSIKAGVPQDSVMEPKLYFLYMVNLPVNRHILTTIFADVKVILYSHINPLTATYSLLNYVVEDSNVNTKNSVEFRKSH